MTEVPETDYSILDRPEFLMFIFHPRPEWGTSGSNGSSRDICVPVGEGVEICGRFHLSGKSAPNILFFHGNGEIVADYDEIAPLYISMGINLLAMDYRGYGRSTGTPTVSAMMEDCHTIFYHVKKWLEDNAFSGPFIVMGRSLGSASVLELVSHYANKIDGLIVESGFAYFGGLLELLGIHAAEIGFKEEKGFRNLDKIRGFDKPTLVIHAEKDHLIPLSDGQALFNESGADEKEMLIIPGANHNDIFLKGLAEIMTAVKTLTAKTKTMGK